jgi:two-component system, response regulator YesN
MITDLRMPFLNGLQLIRNRREAGDSIPIIAISGVDALQLSVAHDYGASATLAKPLDRNELLHAVQSAIDGDQSGWDGVWISYHGEARHRAP